MATYKTRFKFAGGASIDVYVAATAKLEKNFTFGEVTNKQASDSIKLIVTPRMLKFASMVQEFRDWYAKPMTVNSWYRTPSFNKACGGDANSLHLDGLAMDWSVKHTPQQHKKMQDKWAEICAAHLEIGGCNHYTNGYHLSIGEEKFGHTAFKVRDYRGKTGDW